MVYHCELCSIAQACLFLSQTLQLGSQRMLVGTCRFPLGYGCLLSFRCLGAGTSAGLNQATVLVLDRHGCFRSDCGQMGRPRKRN